MGYSLPGFNYSMMDWILHNCLRFQSIRCPVHRVPAQVCNWDSKQSFPDELCWRVNQGIIPVQRKSQPAMIEYLCFYCHNTCALSDVFSFFFQEKPDGIPEFFLESEKIKDGINSIPTILRVCYRWH